MLEGEKAIFVGGNLGVDFFFLVSGFFMGCSALKKSYSNEISLGKETFEFMKRKVSGLLPNVYIGWLVGFVAYHVIRRKTFVTAIKNAILAFWELIFITEAGVIEYRANSVCWYLSAMLIIMLIVYPLVRKYKDTFFYIIGPLIVIFLFGITYQNFTNLSAPHKWFGGFIYKGMLRGTMEIVLGVLLAKIAASIKQIPFTKLSKILFVGCEIVCWGGVILYIFNHPNSKMDWYIVAIMAIGVLITASGISYSSTLITHDIFGWLGEYSFSLYLGHGYWCNLINEIKVIADMPYNQKIWLYLFISFATGLFIMYTSKALKKFWINRGEHIREIFVSSN